MDWTPLWIATWCKEPFDTSRTIKDPLIKECERFYRKRFYVGLDMNGSVFMPGYFASWEEPVCCCEFLIC